MEDKIYTMYDISDIVGRCYSAVALYRSKMGIGKKVGKRGWIFTLADVDKFREYVDNLPPVGHPPGQKMPNRRKPGKRNAEVKDG